MSLAALHSATERSLDYASHGHQHNLLTFRTSQLARLNHPDKERDYPSQTNHFEKLKAKLPDNRQPEDQPILC